MFRLLTALFVTRLGETARMLPSRASRAGKACAVIVLAIVVGPPMTAGRVSAAEVSVQTVAVARGAQGTVSVAYRAKGDSSAALQFDIEYDRSALSLTGVAGLATTGAGKSLAMHDLPNGRARIVISGFNQNVLLDGNVVDIAVKVDRRSRPGTYKLKVFDALGADSSATGVRIRANDGSVVVRP